MVLHVALTTHISSTISSIIKHHRKVKRHATVDVDTGSSKDENHLSMEEDPNLCTTAIFYTITSTQTGLQVRLSNLSTIIAIVDNILQIGSQYGHNQIYLFLLAGN